MIQVPALYLVDFYKVGHVVQYPDDTQAIFINWTPRSSRTGLKKVVNFGGQVFIKEILLRCWNETFFQRPLVEVITQYKEIIRVTLGVKNPKTDHIEYLHSLQYLPIEIFSIPEGFSVPLNCPTMVITNTDEKCFWLPNYIETILSNMVWKACTSATTAQQYRKQFIKYAKEAGETELDFVNYQGHDFSMRGMSGVDDAVLSGMGHLLSFSGTDTVPAILTAKEYYGADYSVGGSVNATEHSVMCAGLKDDEYDTYVRLLTKVYPEGILSIVSDTWDLWHVLTDYLPRMKEMLMLRDGKLVIRPDSGDPVNILCGDHDKPVEHPAYKGVLRLMAEALGAMDRPGLLPMIRKAGAIYGDSITLDRQDQILYRTVHELKMSPFNVVLGIGSFTYEYVTRDTYGWAVKATAVRRGDKLYEIFKKPVTDDGQKNSHKGIVAVYRTQESTEEHPEYQVVQGATYEQLNNCAFDKVFKDSKLLVEYKFDDIRKRVRA
jgi:nicotinamide phosphoribosyltransferase